MISHLVDMAEQSRVDAQVEGVKLLFCNKYIESEEHFAKVSEFDAGSALGSGKCSRVEEHHLFLSIFSLFS